MLKYVLLILIMFIQSFTVCAAEPVKIVFHMNDTFKLGHLANSVKNIREELGAGPKISVVINGNAVKLMLRNDIGVQKWLKKKALT